MTDFLSCTETDGYDNWTTTRNWDAMVAAWMEVGIAQRDMPVHVVNEYCHPYRSFYPLPAFNEANLPRSVRFYCYNEPDGEHHLFPLDISDSAGLGVDSALMRGSMDRVLAATPAWPLFRGTGEDAAISHLDEVRTVDLMRSRENLLPTDLEPSHGMRGF